MICTFFTKRTSVISHRRGHHGVPKTFSIHSYPHVQTKDHDPACQRGNRPNESSIEGCEITWELVLVGSAPVHVVGHGYGSSKNSNGSLCLELSELKTVFVPRICGSRRISSTVNKGFVSHQSDGLNGLPTAEPAGDAFVSVPDKNASCSTS